MQKPNRTLEETIQSAKSVADAQLKAKQAAEEHAAAKKEHEAAVL